MNKYLTLSLMALGSLATASDLMLGTSVGVGANLPNQELGKVGLAVSVENHRPFSADTDYFVSGSISAPVAFERDAVKANLVVGGSMKELMPSVSGLAGVSVEVNQFNDSYKVAPGVMIGGLYGFSENWVAKGSATVSVVSSDETGHYDSSELVTSIGVSRVMPIDA